MTERVDGETRGIGAAPTRGGLGLGCWVAIVLVAALLALVIPALARAGRSAYREAAAQRAAEDVERDARRIAAAVEAYRADTGRLPASLEELTAEAAQGQAGGACLETVPPNPASGRPEWTYDPARGTVTDPTGTWTGAALASDASVGAAPIDQGLLPPVRGGAWGGDGTEEYSPVPPRAGRKWVFVYAFRTRDESVRSDLRVLANAPPEAEVVGVLLPPEKEGQVERPFGPADAMAAMQAGRPFGIIDARRDASAFLAAAGIEGTPVLFVCDERLRRRARLAGALHAEDLTKLLEQIEAHRRALHLGR